MKNDLRNKKIIIKTLPSSALKTNSRPFKTNDQLEAPSSLWPGGMFGAALGNLWKR